MRINQAKSVRFHLERAEPTHVVLPALVHRLPVLVDVGPARRAVGAQVAAKLLQLLVDRLHVLVQIRLAVRAVRTQEAGKGRRRRRRCHLTYVRVSLWLLFNCGRNRNVAAAAASGPPAVAAATFVKLPLLLLLLLPLPPLLLLLSVAAAAAPLCRRTDGRTDEQAYIVYQAANERTPRIMLLLLFNVLESYVVVHRSWQFCPHDVTFNIG